MYNTVYKKQLWRFISMKELKIKGYAKINLALDIIGKREDGYHEVKMLMQQIDLFDVIRIVKTSDDDIQVQTNLEYLPNNEDNIAYKAAKLFRDTFQINDGVRIIIDKNIPVSAGLAGGSTDAAAVLKGLNLLWGKDLDTSVLMSMGKSIGADVPFCIKGGSALAEGIGEVLTPISGIDTFVVLCKPNIRVSTAEVYQKFKLNKVKKRPDIDQMVEDIKNQKPIEIIRKNMINVLESVTMEENIIIYNIKKKMLECQGEAALMSGSGPTVYGLFRDYDKAKLAYENLRRLYKETFLVKTIV